MFKFVYRSDWISKLFLGVLAFVFILGTAVMFGPGSWNFGFGSYAVKVGDITVTPKEFRLVLERLSYQLGGKLPDKQIKNLALNELVVNSLFAYLAERDGFYISQKEITDYIRKTFSVNGTFSPQLFEEFLKVRRLTPKEYEDFVRKILLASKYKSAVFATTYANDKELETVTLPFVLTLKVKVYTLPLAEFSKKVKVSEEELKKFYGENRSRFTVEEPARILIFKVKDEEKLKKLYEILKSNGLPDIKPLVEIPVDKVDTLKGELKEFAQKVLRNKKLSVEKVEGGYLLGVFLPKGRKIPTFEEIKKSVENLLKSQKALQYLREHSEELKRKVLKGEIKVEPQEITLTAYGLMNRYGLTLDAVFQMLKGRKTFTVVNGDGLTVLVVENLKEEKVNLPLGEFKKLVRNGQYTRKLQGVIDYVLKTRSVKIEVNKQLLGF